MKGKYLYTYIKRPYLLSQHISLKIQIDGFSLFLLEGKTKTLRFISSVVYLSSKSSPHTIWLWNLQRGDCLLNSMALAKLAGRESIAKASPAHVSARKAWSHACPGAGGALVSPAITTAQWGRTAKTRHSVPPPRTLQSRRDHEEEREASESEGCWGSWWPELLGMHMRLVLLGRESPHGSLQDLCVTCFSWCQRERGRNLWIGLSCWVLTQKSSSWLSLRSEAKLYPDGPFPLLSTLQCQSFDKWEGRKRLALKTWNTRDDSVWVGKGIVKGDN